MKIPDLVLDTFNKEAEGVTYGKITLGMVVRGSHTHYEIDKHITLADGKEAKEDRKNGI